jgi:hypothetical protein
MERSTVISLLVVVGLGGLVLWWYMRAPATETGAAQTLPGNCGSGVMGTIGNFIKGHVDRKNSLAPLVAQGYAKIPAAQAAPITNIAGKLSPSSWLESKIAGPVGDFFCEFSIPSFSAIKNAIENTGKQVVSTSTSFGTSQLAAGTINPVKSLGSAADNLVHGNFGDAAGDVAHSVYDGPKAAVTATYEAGKDAYNTVKGWF